LSSNFHGIPRSTRDADFVIELDPRKLQRLGELRWVNEAHRPKDREDVRNILAVRGSELDGVYLRRWATEHGTLALLEEIGNSIPPA
jgi:hypothetical protein